MAGIAGRWKAPVDGVKTFVEEFLQLLAPEAAREPRS